MRAVKSRLLIFSGLATIALALTAVALAGTVTATTTVTGAGAVSLSTGSTATLSDTIDGTDQAVNYTLPLTLTDARGTGAGWNLTITSTTFNTGTHAIATSASSVASVTSSCVAGGTCTNPTNSIAYPLTIPAGTTAPTAVKLFNAALNTGLGRFTITPSINVTIPGNSYAGSYTSTITIAAVSGP
jgi:WxL domain surface cell wall-binding